MNIPERRKSKFNYFPIHPFILYSDVQAIACVAMHIAESDMFRGTRREIQLSLDQLAYLTDGAYTTKQLEDVEQRVSEMIESDRNEERINVLHFINLYRRQKMLNIEIELTVLAYLKCILMHRITNYQLPSKIVAACIYLARSGSDYENIWNEQLEKLSSYRKEDIEDTVQIVDALAMKNIESTTTDTDLCFNQIYLSCNNNKKRVRV